MSDEAAGEPAQAPVPPGPVPRLRESARPEPTGDARVDEALARLAELDAAPVSGHVEIFEGIHQRLQELLASAGQDDPGAGSPVPRAGSPAAGPGASGPRPPTPMPRPPAPGPRPGAPGPRPPGTEPRDRWYGGGG
ncbi:hypothetical protein ACQP1W_35875 [Spirillospora sp. CA-255316]